MKIYLKKQPSLAVSDADVMLDRLNALKLQGVAIAQEYQESLEVREVVLEAKDVEIDQLRLLEREKVLKREDVSQGSSIELSILRIGKALSI